MEEQKDVSKKVDDLDLSSEVEESKEVKQEERTVPLQALQEERKKRQELEQRLSALETSFQQPSYTSEENNPDLEEAINKIEPYLRKKGFLTKEELEAEKNAQSYAEEMRSLSEKYDGKDGRPVFDAYEVSEFGKKNKIYNLEAAYERMYKKELFDWELKKTGNPGETIETEKGSSGVKEAGNTPLLSREAIQRKLAAPDGKVWWEKNREKIMAAYARGEIS